MSSAIVTVAIGQATERLDYTFLSFAEKNPGVPLHAFILGEALPQRRFPQIEYHLVKAVPDFSHPLREIYYRRLEFPDQLGVEYALVVDCFDVLCLQPLPPFEQILGGAHLAGCIEHLGSCPIQGQGYTSNFLNGGVMFWNIPGSRDIRQAVIERGKSHFRTVADDQFCLNEVVQTLHYDRLRILPCQYNYRGGFDPVCTDYGYVHHLDGVLIYHNMHHIPAVKQLTCVARRAVLPPLPPDGHPLTPREQFWRRLRVQLTKRLKRGRRHFKKSAL
jgi:hypothetical protein